ncbi:MAG: putative DNA binding domain-containing protein [Fusobacteriaceae bacterium]|jgi:ATP-dependent DNA helicase RecG|nr:putative DNA binding domain-containing protein [Fusobacteriaceae bacterium]
MLEEELIELAKTIQLHKSETRTIEVKSAHKDCPKRLYDTLSSFSNQDSGGTIVFGLDESKNFAAVGVYDGQNLQKKVTEQCTQMEPQVRGIFTIARFQDVSICSVEIPPLDITERPCYYKGLGKSKGSYIRVGEADMPMTEYEVYNYESYKKHRHDDERIIDRADFTFMEQELLNRYVYEMKKDRPMFAKLAKDHIYELLGITRDGKPTLAAILCFNLYPQQYFRQLGITAIVIPGYEIGDVGSRRERFLDNKRIEGTIGEMVEGAVAFCRRNMKVAVIIDPDTGLRHDKPEYPIEAIREIILNALIHRDYSPHSEGIPVQINFFADRLEVHNPGTLYGRISVEQLGIARPDLRNPTLAGMAEVLTGTENRYSGIPTIRNAMREAGLPPPVFENRRNEFVVTLYNGAGKYGKEPQKTPSELGEADVKFYLSKEDMILDFCVTPRTRREIADILQMGTIFYVTKHYINPLVAAGKLALTIPDKPKSKLQKYYTKS